MKTEEQILMNIEAEMMVHIKDFEKKNGFVPQMPEIAEKLGTCKQNIYRILKKFEKEGIIKFIKQGNYTWTQKQK